MTFHHLSRRSVDVGLLLVLGGLVLVSRDARAEDTSAEPAPAAETVHFGFSVDDGEVWIKSMQTHSSRDYKGKAPLSENEINSDVRLRFERGTQGTTSVVLEALSAETKINGLVQPNPAQKIALGQRTRLHLDAQGKAVAGDGFVELMRRFERDLDPQTYALVRRQMTADSMKNGEIAEWNRPFDGIRGEEATVGDTWLVLSEKFLQGNFIPLSGTLTFEGWTELDGFRALRVHYRYDSTGKIYEAAKDDATRSLNLRPKERKRYQGHNLILSGETTWLLIPEKGLPLYETHQESMSVPLSADPGAERGEVKDSHTYRYRPQPSADGS